MLICTLYHIHPFFYQEYADCLNQLTPEQAEEHRRSVEKALAAARELDEVKKKLDEQRVENEDKMRKENEGDNIVMFPRTFFSSAFFCCVSCF